MSTINKFSTYLDRKFTLILSFAVSLIDEFAAEQPIGDTRVFIKDRNLKSIKNRSGYHVFFNLPDEKFNVCVESENYFEEEISVKLSDFNRLNPAKTITLKPKPSYPFPPGATLIRGMVKDSNGNFVSGAKVEVIGMKISNKTTAKGEFVLYFNVLTEEEIIMKNSKRYVKGDVDGAIKLKATLGSKTGKADLMAIEEGQTTPLESPIIID